VTITVISVISGKVCRLSILATVAVLVTLPAAAQEHHAAPSGLPLHPTSKVAIPTEANRPIYKPARCDAQGNIYFRAYQSDDRKVPVIRADAKGASIRYSLDTDPDFAKATSYDFSVLPDGNLYQPVQVGEDVYIVAFDQQGHIRRKTRLERKFWVARLTALNDHSFLLLGTESQAGKQTPKAVIALFDDQGKLVRNVALDLPKKESGNNSQETAPVLAVLSSDAQVTAEKVVYLMLHTNPVVAYALDSSGEVKRTIQVNPPGPKMTAVSMSATSGRLAILFREIFRGMQHNDLGTLLVVDASTGAEIAKYAVTAEVGTTLACYTPDAFTFLGSEGDRLAIQSVSGK
jgi:hypothetical protein